MNKIVIRRAKKEDIPLLLPLMEQLGYPQELKDMQKHFQNFTSQEGYGVAVVKQGAYGKIVFEKRSMMTIISTEDYAAFFDICPATKEEAELVDKKLSESSNLRQLLS